ncbi:MAG: hypothetical protein H6819_09675 [Phycisphaerales bacterium]|nr:hypothetical protein [Phycisphaerales bacterium]MCB9855494.1 hypothetical protein [Phycisphaerales bacterium]
MNSPRQSPDDQATSLDFIQVSRSILHLATRGPGRFEFLREASRIILPFACCDVLELRVDNGSPVGRYRWSASQRPAESFSFDLQNAEEAPAKTRHTPERAGADANEFVAWLDNVVEVVASGDVGGVSRCVTAHGSFWTPNATADLAFKEAPRLSGDESGAPVQSLAIIPFEMNAESPGVLVLMAVRKHAFTSQNIEFYESLAQTLGLAIDDRRAQHALRERVKELMCLYSIAQILETPDITVLDAIQRIVELIPSAWQFPDSIAARISLDDIVCSHGDMDSVVHLQEAPIRIDGRRRGTVDVGYVEEHPEFVEGAFLPEEQHLVRAIAREVAQFAQRRAAIEEKLRLAEQVRQADRLATIGQLAAGVAHEINEPLGAILGFAQLAKKASGVPESTEQDLEKIVGAALHARTIVRKLMLFARQSPPSKSFVHLNAIVHEGLTLLKPRLSESRVDVARDLDPADPVVFADAVQLHQLVVNLCVNGLQSMSKGGRLTVRTRGSGPWGELEVQDQGGGIAPEIADRIFEPFFTTKSPEQGTGLGLSVVHGIVLSHGGTIDYESKAESGTRFCVRLPTSPPEDGHVE